jgi:hemerythrin
MPTTLTIPTLFGRATAVLGEHANLHRILDRLRDLRTKVGDGRAEPRPDRRQLMQEFREQLCAHFAAEEDDGYFGMLVSASPALSTEVARLRREHEEFLLLVQRLVMLAESDGDREEFAVALSGFLDRFNAHEHAENLLLQEFFLRDEGVSG